MIKEKSKSGRPPYDIPAEQFEKLCGIQCTKTEIAAFFSCDPDTIQAWCKRHYGKDFNIVFDEKRKLGFVSLRRNQFRMAENSVPMAIFLGKNLLGQRDNPVAETIDAQTALSKIAEYIMNGCIASKPETAGVDKVSTDEPKKD